MMMLSKRSLTFCVFKNTFQNLLEMKTKKLTRKPRHQNDYYITRFKAVQKYHHFFFRLHPKHFTPQQKSAITRQYSKFKYFIDQNKIAPGRFIVVPYRGTSKRRLKESSIFPSHRSTNKGLIFRARFSRKGDRFKARFDKKGRFVVTKNAKTTVYLSVNNLKMALNPAAYIRNRVKRAGLDKPGASVTIVINGGEAFQSVPLSGIAKLFSGYIDRLAQVGAITGIAVHVLKTTNKKYHKKVDKRKARSKTAKKSSKKKSKKKGVK